MLMLYAALYGTNLQKVGFVFLKGLCLLEVKVVRHTGHYVPGRTAIEGDKGNLEERR